MIQEQWCRYCRFAKALEYDEKFIVQTWYCTKFKEKIPSYVLIVNCPGYEDDGEYQEDD